MEKSFEKSNETYPLLQKSGKTDKTSTNVQDTTLSESQSIQLSIQDLKVPSLKQVIGAYILAFVSMFGSCLSVASVQVLAGTIPEFELNAWRFSFQIFTASPLVKWREGGIKMPRKVWHSLFLSIVVIVGFNATFYTAAIYVPVGTLAGLNNTVVIVMNSILSIYYINERRVHLYVSAVLSVTAILLLTQPFGLFIDNQNRTKSNWTSPCLKIDEEETIRTEMNTNKTINIDNSGQEWIGYVFLVISGGCAAGAYRFVRLTVAHASPYALSCWCGFFGCISSLILMAAFEDPVLPNNPLCYGLLFIHAIGTSIYSVFFPYCLQFISPAIYVFIRSLQLVVLLILQYTALKEVMPGIGNWMEIMGGVLCFIGCIISPTYQIIQEITKRRKKEQYDSA